MQWDLLLSNAHIATMRRGNVPYGLIENGAIAISGGRIAWIGSMESLPEVEVVQTHDLGGQWLSPALIDCHTHLVFAGDRSLEFELRLNGASYEEIASAGGGIKSTMEATRDADLNTLVESAESRLQALMREGVATVEIKSGYGLSLESELRMLEAARALGDRSAVTVVTTFLGAHAVPPEFQGRTDDYIDYLVDTILPEVHQRKLADAVDAYCERIAFSVDQTAKVFEAAQSLGLPVKLHADQLSDCGGAELAARFGALSADHLEYSSQAGVEAMATAGTVAVLLPGAFLTLGESQLPPLTLLRSHDVPMAVATDCNPGTSPLCSLQTAMGLAARLFKLTPEECLAGVTREAARALGMDGDRGTLEVGKRADIAVWNITHPRELSYWTGLNRLDCLYIDGTSAV